MSTKNIAISLAIIVVSLMAVSLAEINVIMRGINPAAALAAVTVVIIGVMWLKKNSKSIIK